MTEKEPSRGILYRSAATLALHAQLLRDAERAAMVGLLGNPPREIASQLREVMEKATFATHLQLQGIILGSNEIQMTLVGNAIGPGMAPASVVVERIQSVGILVQRTAQRLDQKVFGKKTQDDLYNVYMSPPRVGSFALTLRIGNPIQMTLPGFADYERLIDEFMHNLNLLNENRTEDLRHAISDNDYYQSFVGVAKKLVPDGNNVRAVGFTTLRGDVERTVDLTVTSNDVKPMLLSKEDFKSQTEESMEQLSITGELLFANSMSSSKHTIRVRDDTGKQHTIITSKAIAEDVVKPYFGSRVTVEVLKKGKKLVFIDINSLK